MATICDAYPSHAECQAHRAEIKAALKEQGVSLARLARESGYSPSGLRQHLAAGRHYSRLPSCIVEAAKKLGLI